MKKCAVCGEIHFAVFLFGLSGLFAKFILLPAIMIVLGRVIFASVFLLIVLRWLKLDVRLQRPQHYVAMLIMGVILAVHWWAFFLSIQITSVAIGLLTFATFPAFVAFLEPFVFREKIRLSEVVTACIAFAGIMLVVPRFEIDNHITQGVLWGLLSGFTYAILSVLNRKYVSMYSGLTVAFHEQLIAAAVLLPFLFWRQPELHLQDIILLLFVRCRFYGGFTLSVY